MHPKQPPLLRMMPLMKDELLIYPIVRAFVAKLAGMAAGLATATAVCALGELLLAPMGFIGVALFAGSLSELFMSLLLAIVAWVALWCHLVLLAGRGIEWTRYGVLMVAVLSLLMPVCTAYLMLTGKPLLLRQADLPLICTAFLALCVLLNLPRGVAAGRLHLALISVFAGMALLYGLTNLPEMVWVNDLCKIVACGAVWYPLRALSCYACCVVALPPLEDDAERK